ncbi:hypothetical protein PFICI_08485 [Pestalotiopsis fici W106-1]|uniref:Uncharacterized protein n=1 Tax=Pestalotiopsis fici (strain W106-1 / CGMCC3.15140) TaxID=1229662 RepID=W3X6Z9_PESFW|nr:uncharacterized protein PFICI_08485 [Pestalotiopsis fici W106-1]ETS80956.1 hypothetical protein PFICI_08485 [Pestalotiopsis fici W106-1]
MVGILKLPNRGPYDPMYDDLEEPEDGMVHSQMPPDEKFYEDPDFYDTLGRSLVEQRKVFTVERSAEEQIDMVHAILEQCPTGPSGVSRAWNVCLEAAIKNAATVMEYLVKNQNLHVRNAPEQALDLKVEVHIAASMGNLDVLKILIERAGADINVINNLRTPLSIAALNGEIDTVKWLIEHGADCTEDSETLILSSHGGKVEILNLLLDHVTEKESDKPKTAWFDRQMLGNAASSGSEEMMRFVMELGGYGTATENSEEQREAALEAIPRAFKNDRTNQACVDLAIRSAIPKNGAGDFIRSDNALVFDCLKSAVSNCCIIAKPEDMRHMLELVLQCTKVTKDSAPFSQLLVKAIRGCYHPKSQACAKELLDHWGASANTNDPNEDNCLPLAPAAISFGELDYVRFWLDHGADIHRATGPFSNGPTALSWAVRLGNVEAVLLLLDRGGPIDYIAGGLERQKRLCVRCTGELGVVSLLAAESVKSKEDDWDGEDGADDGSVADGVKSIDSGTNEDDDEDDETDYAPGADEVVIELAQVTQAWLEKIQLRRPVADLAQDGTGRPVKETSNSE